MITKKKLRECLPLSPKIINWSSITALATLAFCTWAHFCWYSPIQGTHRLLFSSRYLRPLFLSSSDPSNSGPLLFLALYVCRWKALPMADITPSTTTIGRLAGRFTCKNTGLPSNFSVHLWSARDLRQVANCSTKTSGLIASHDDLAYQSSGLFHAS